MWLRASCRHPGMSYLNGHYSALLSDNCFSNRHLLQLSLPLIREHGFTQKTLSLSVLSLPTHAEPLSDSAVSSLFGSGNDARRTLIKYWMEDAKSQMKRQSTQSPSMKHVLRKRLEWNEDVLQYLPEANRGEPDHLPFR